MGQDPLCFFSRGSQLKGRVPLSYLQDGIVVLRGPDANQQNQLALVYKAYTDANGNVLQSALQLRGSGTWHDLIGIQKDIWYHVVLDLNFADQTYGATVTSQGQTFTFPSVQGEDNGNTNRKNSRGRSSRYNFSAFVGRLHGRYLEQELRPLESTQTMSVIERNLTVLVRLMDHSMPPSKLTVNYMAKGRSSTVLPPTKGLPAISLISAVFAFAISVGRMNKWCTGSPLDVGGLVIYFTGLLAAWAVASSVIIVLARNGRLRRAVLISCAVGVTLGLGIVPACLGFAKCFGL